MRRWLYRATFLLPFIATVGAMVWALSLNPFTAPLVERTTEEIAVALERQMARQVTPEWLEPRFAEAVEEGDVDRIEMLLDLSLDYDVPLSVAALEQARDEIERASGFLANVRGCGACMIDISVCERLAQIAACAVPFEMTPAGDVNALRRAGLAWTTGAEVDRLDVGLAFVGLGATAAIFASGGTSATVKVGTATLRLTRRIGSLTPALAGQLARMSNLTVQWAGVPAYIAGRVPLDQVTDARKVAQLSALAGDLGKVRANTSLAQTLLLMRHVDSAADATRLARVSEAVGQRTRHAFAVLGKSRVMRSVVRVSRLAVSAVALIYLAVLQLLLMVASQLTKPMVRLLRMALSPA